MTRKFSWSVKSSQFCLQTCKPQRHYLNHDHRRRQVVHQQGCFPHVVLILRPALSLMDFLSMPTAIFPLYGLHDNRFTRNAAVSSWLWVTPVFDAVVVSTRVVLDAFVIIIAVTPPVLARTTCWAEILIWSCPSSSCKDMLNCDHGAKLYITFIWHKEVFIYFVKTY